MKKSLTLVFAVLIMVFAVPAGASAAESEFDINQTEEFQAYKSFVTGPLFEASLSSTPMTQEEYDDLIMQLDDASIAVDDAFARVSEEAEDLYWGEFNKSFNQQREAAKKEAVQGKNRAVSVFKKSKAAINRKFKAQARKNRSAAVRQKKAAVKRAVKRRSTQVQLSARKMKTKLSRINIEAENSWPESDQCLVLDGIIESNQNAIGIVNDWANSAMDRIEVE